jgi:hypothetical protein
MDPMLEKAQIMMSIGSCAGNIPRVLIIAWGRPGMEWALLEIFGR